MNQNLNLDMLKIGPLLYEGKAKKVFKTEQSDMYFIEFKDSLTAFNALKKGSFDDKGKINRDISALIFEYLKIKGISSHYIGKKGELGFVASKVEIIPYEVVVRNILAGSTAKKLGIEEGKILSEPLVEFYFKDDRLADPFVSCEQMRIIHGIEPILIEKLKKQALRVNYLLKELFSEIQLKLVDFKIEFGQDEHSEVLLADEITPDCCRLWDVNTNEKMDKDRFRRDLGNIRESYLEVLKRLNVLMKKYEVKS